MLLAAHGRMRTCHLRAVHHIVNRFTQLLACFSVLVDVKVFLVLSGIYANAFRSVNNYTAHYSHVPVVSSVTLFALALHLRCDYASLVKIILEIPASCAAHASLASTQMPDPAATDAYSPSLQLASGTVERQRWNVSSC